MVGRAIEFLRGLPATTGLQANIPRFFAVIRIVLQLLAIKWIWTTMIESIGVLAGFLLLAHDDSVRFVKRGSWVRIPPAALETIVTPKVRSSYLPTVQYRRDKSSSSFRLAVLFAVIATCSIVAGILRFVEKP